MEEPVGDILAADAEGLSRGREHGVEGIEPVRHHLVHLSSWSSVAPFRAFYALATHAQQFLRAQGSGGQT